MCTQNCTCDGTTNGPNKYANRAASALRADALLCPKGTNKTACAVCALYNPGAICFANRTALAKASATRGHNKCVN